MWLRISHTTSLVQEAGGDLPKDILDLLHNPAGVGGRWGRTHVLFDFLHNQEVDRHAAWKTSIFHTTRLLQEPDFSGVHKRA